MDVRFDSNSIKKHSAGVVMFDGCYILVFGLFFFFLFLMDFTAERQGLFGFLSDIHSPVVEWLLILVI